MNQRKAKTLRRAAHIMAEQDSILRGNPAAYPPRSAVRIYRTLKKQCLHNKELYQAVRFVVAAHKVGAASRDTAEKFATLAQKSRDVAKAFGNLRQQIRESGQRPSRNLGVGGVHGASPPRGD